MPSSFTLTVLLCGLHGAIFLAIGFGLGARLTRRTAMRAAHRHCDHANWHTTVLQRVLEQLVRKCYMESQTLRTLIQEAEREIPDPAGYVGCHSLSETIRAGQ
jgi:hypothetical protein